uniref:ATP-binding cassette sub-family D member 3 n=1 Tax=Caenorhabditis tropicalis TaxID=1561998 RepID=A0A1I7TV66_9PELO
MAVLSKLQLLGQAIPPKQYAPGMVGMLAVFALVKLYKQDIRGTKHLVAKTKKDGSKAHVDGVFLSKLARILKILIPRLFSKETFYLALIAISLLCRTYADVYMIITSTKIEASIIDRNPLLFALEAFKYVLNLPAISVTNALLKFGIAELKLRFRERLSTHLYSQYLKGFTFYKMSNLDTRIQNADQLLTQDVDRFCDGIVELYSNLSKPILDVFLYLFRLGTSLGFSSPSILFSYLLFTGVGLTYLRRPIGRLTVEEQALEGEYRYVNSRLIMNSEEIAFYQGNQSEKETIMSTFASLVQHLRKIILFRFSIGFIDNIVAKYLATVVGWYAVGSSFFDKKHKPFIGMSRNELMQEYYNSGRMMYKMAEALGRLALAGRDMTRLSGFTSRVDTLLNVLDDVNNGNYKRTMVGEKDESMNSLLKSDLVAGSGNLLVRDNVIRFENVPLVTPNGDVLIESLNLEVPSGRNVLVCGPNGCGKSSLFRVLGELWPLFGGTLTKPAKGKLFYVPQRPYMTLGTLRDQIIYPDRPLDMIRKGISDLDLEQMLENVQLTHILEREGGWSAVQDWMDVLSGGEKQRIAMARLFYHKPQFAILDECTSAVSVDVEGAMYRLCREMNITLFTVSHRKSLWKYHEYSLYMDGRGSYRFEQIDDQSDQFGS